MTIVITGAAGMIGSGIVRYLNDLGNDQLILVDDLKDEEKWKNLVGKKFIDLFSKHLLLEWLQKNQSQVDAIIHMGACSNTVEKDADYLLENNYRYTIRLAKWALEHDKRFIYASSAATYGLGEEGFEDDESKLDLLKPLNMYGFSKHLVDLWMKRQNAFDRVVALKYFNVFGPNENHKKNMSSMVFKMTQKLQTQDSIQLFKSNHEKYAHGAQVRDFIYVKDAVKMSCAFLEKKNRSIGGIFNIGQGKPTTWNTLAEALFKAVKKEKRIEYIDMPQNLIKQYQNYTCAVMGKLQKALPEIVTTTPIEGAVEEYVQKYLLKGNRW